MGWWGADEMVGCLRTELTRGSQSCQAASRGRVGLAPVSLHRLWTCVIFLLRLPRAWLQVELEE